MQLELLDGPAAAAELASADFRHDWQELYDACDWATGFQSPDFALAWYGTYAAAASPLLVVARYASRRLEALLALAVDASGRVTPVGAHQAEYQGWLARDEDGARFMAAAVEALRRRFPRGSLRFRYLPPRLPEGWCRADPLRKLVSTRPEVRPLVRLDQAEVAARLRKSGNRSRLKRLAEAGGGEIRARVLSSSGELAELIGPIAQHYDERQLAMNGVAPFAQDPFKAGFHIALMDAGVLHAFVLTAGPTLVAAVLSVRSRGFVSVGVFAHSAALADHSPGKFAVLELARTGAAEGYTEIDLTPGGAWKERFSTCSEPCSEATLWFDRRDALRALGTEWALKLGRRTIALAGLTPGQLRRLTGRARVARRDLRSQTPR